MYYRNLVSLFWKPDPTPALKAVFTFPVHQEIITQNTTYVPFSGSSHSVRVYAPDDSALEIWGNGSKLGDATADMGNPGYWDYSWSAPNITDFDGWLMKAVGNVSGDSDELTLVIAEANRLNQTLSSWSQLTLFTTSMTSGQTDPFGGSNAWRFNNPTANSQRAYYTSASPSITENNSGFEVWFKPNQITMVAISLGNVGGYINLATGETRATNQFIKKIQDGPNGWKRYWFQRTNQVAAESSFFIYPVTTWGSLVANTTSGDNFYIYRPRSVNGQQFQAATHYQRTILQLGSTAGVVQTWNYHSPLIDTIADMGAGYYDIQVIRPSGWSSSADPYQTIILLPALFDSQETSAGNQTPAQMEAAHSIANTYNAVVCVPFLRTGAIFWWGIKNDGTINQKTFLAKVVTEFLIEFHNVAEGRENRTLVGYSKSAFGGLSNLLQFPEEFGYFSGYDSPWNQAATDWSANQAANVYGNEATFDANDPIQILPSYLDSVNDKRRLSIYGYETFQSDTTTFHNALDSYTISHDYSNTDLNSHSWQAGTWFEDGIALAQANRAA